MRIQILILGFKVLNKREYWDREGISGCSLGYLNFTKDVLRGCH